MPERKVKAQEANSSAAKIMPAATGKEPASVLNAVNSARQINLPAIPNQGEVLYRLIEVIKSL
jgi:hypothetical protein